MLRLEDDDFFGNGDLEDDDFNMLLNAPLDSTQQVNDADEDIDVEAG
jgi:hypothetical protein